MNQGPFNGIFQTIIMYYNNKQTRKDGDTSTGKKLHFSTLAGRLFQSHIYRFEDDESKISLYSSK